MVMSIVICATCGAVIPAGNGVPFPAAKLQTAHLILCRACGDLDLEVDP